MAIIAPKDIQREYDAIVVGSGAAGGQAAYTLAMEGVKVLMLEAGRKYAAEEETPMFQTPAEAPLRAATTPDKPFGFFDATVDGGWDVPGEPYTAAARSESAPGDTFRWWRSRMLGGRTNHWGRYAFRNGPYDFKPRARDGLGWDWPISYYDVAPYYDKVEMLIGVYGDNNGLENTPDSPPGCLLPPPKPRVSDLLFRKAGREMGIPVVASHRAVLTQRLDAAVLPAKLHPGNARAQAILRDWMERRAACFWATHCGRGCAIRANHQSTTVHIPPALNSGNLDIVCHAMAREITLGPNGRSRGVIFIDTGSGREHEAKARVVVLAASAAESVRLLLNSKTSAFPQGLGNSSGLVGRHLMDTVGSDFRAQIPSLEGLPTHNEEGAGGGHVYAPWWMYRRQLAGELGFARGYHIEYHGGRQMPNIGIGTELRKLTGGSYGRRFKADVRRYYGTFVLFSGRGEMIPNENSYCEIDPARNDRWGVPVLRFHWKWSEHETKQAAHMQTTFAEIVRLMGGRTLTTPEPNGAKAISAGGEIIHEVGGAMMGEDPAKSVTDRWGRVHEVPNLFIADGATFCSNADKNPTLTIMALAWRTSDYIVAKAKRKEL